MLVTKKEKSMIMGVSTSESNGKIYFSCDLYDLENGGLYRCDMSSELYQNLVQQPKPLMINECVLDISAQYQFRSRLSLVSVK